MKRIRTLAALTLAGLVTIFLVAQKAPAPNERDPGWILKTIDEIIDKDASAWCEEKGLTYPPDAVVLRIFKKERELEIWARNEGQERMQFVKTTPICSMDFDPGPKLRLNDFKTPEGFYYMGFGYGSKHFWMWIDLKHVDEPGEVGTGSCFKMCSDYPNPVDRARTAAAKFNKTGGEICMHGNCVTAGCPSFKNRDFLPVFAFSRHHNVKKFGRLQIHIFPFRFDKVTDHEKEIGEYVHLDSLGKEKLLQVWQNLKEGFDLFNANPNPLSFGYGKTGYVYRK